MAQRYAGWNDCFIKNIYVKLFENLGTEGGYIARDDP